MSSKYILYNQAIVPRDSFSLSPEEWFDLSSIAIRQSLFASGNRVPFLRLWLDLFGKRLESVGWHLPDEFGFTEFKAQLEKLLNRNRLFKGSWIHLLIIPVFPSAELDCSPTFKCIGLTEEVGFDYFPLNQKGLAIGVSERYHNTADPFVSSMIRSPQRSLMIRQEAALNGWDEIILTDRNGFLSEGSESNIFIRSQDRIYTPAPENLGFPRIITGIVRALIPRTGCRLEETGQLRPEDLSKADEIFFTDDRNGIRWVMGIEKKRFYRKAVNILHEELTELIRTTDQFQEGFSG